jgi:hypothetical protein
MVDAIWVKQFSTRCDLTQSLIITKWSAKHSNTYAGSNPVLTTKKSFKKVSKRLGS